jgi:hypothetical protein
MTKQLPRSRLEPINRDLIALFPNEITRSPSSDYLLSCQHDVPWEEPDLVRGVLNQMRRTQIRKQARGFVEYCPEFADSRWKTRILRFFSWLSI